MCNKNLSKSDGQHCRCRSKVFCWMLLIVFCCIALGSLAIFCKNCIQSSGCSSVSSLPATPITNIICDSTCCPCKGDCCIDSLTTKK